ncbi:GNAT family N-acetyltransferase [Streptomyces pinistramenti]|uniref:GNAT family N-acetyltransferase n=1 Tax=Streptomyces pinistramenti TaxID=2884812 RepID=UPI001D06B996|nr:GNAT family N-acetyltransferase [Streptomyces pinistramenti]MCB5907653.1 GNAT family N-acetyltransferase [Streptomyces pinistramenti]
MIELRDLTPGDAPAVQRIYSGASVTFTRTHGMTAEEAADYVENALAHARTTPRERWCFAITVGDDVVGLVKFRNRGHRHAAASYILRENTWGNGYATEALKQAVGYAFTHAGIIRLSAKHHPDNPASGRVLIKAGFIRTGTVPTGPALGRPGVDFLVYEIRRRDNQT